MSKALTFIVSGGGTGGHIFPAVSIADGIKDRFPHAEILFIGALGRMEMERVPSAGYPIVGLPISGLQRKHWAKNFSLPLKIIASLWKVYRTLRRVRPDVVIGTGGYASAPTLWMAQRMGIPTVIQEQNSYAGITNQWVAPRAKAICVAYSGMEKWFPSDRVFLTGNPVRNMVARLADAPRKTEHKKRAVSALGFDPNRPLVVVLGGSQGARAINQAIEKWAPLWLADGIQVLWQCGALYKTALQKSIVPHPDLQWMPFLDDMLTVYKAATLVVSRAGAGTLSELACAGLPVVLIPSPNVAEDHQTHNAQALVDKNAAIMVREKDIHTVDSAVRQLIQDEARREALASAIRSLAKPRATEEIVEHIVQAL